MTPKLILAFAVVSAAISIGGLSAKADPAGSAGLSLGPTGLAPLGLPDRDVVRDPYSGLLGGSGSVSGLLLQNVGVNGPNLGLGVGFSPGLILGGGGGGGGIPTTFGMSAPLPVAGGNSNPGTGLTLPLVIAPGGATLPNQVLSPITPSSSNISNFEEQVVAPSVPDGGHSAIMLGAGLLMAFAFQRRLSRKK
jgi:hypothetical protein